MPYAVDFGAIMAMGVALDVDQRLLAAVLPAFERVIIDAFNGDDTTGEEESNDG